MICLKRNPKYPKANVARKLLGFTTSISYNFQTNIIFTKKRKGHNLDNMTFFTGTAPAH
jgi:hypothetical protein